MKNVFAVVLFFVSSAALAEVHSYTIPRIGATKEQCEKVESWVVSRFANLAEASVLTHGCEFNPHRTYDLVIEYSRSVAAKLVTTYDEYAYVNALYDTAEDCAAHYDEDMATFKEATGIEPLIAYCIHDRRDPEADNGWTMRIDGFGKPKLSPRHLARDFFNGINGDVASLKTGLKTTLDAYGAKYTKVNIKATPNRAIIHAMYYSANKLPIVQYSEGQFKSLEACEKNREEMREVFARAGGETAIFFCGGSTYTSKIYIYTAGLVMQPLATTLTSIKFETMEACEARRDETETAWRDGLEKNVVGSVCAIEDAVTREFVRMRMFWLD